MMAGKPYHRGKHNEWSRRLRAVWNARPDTRCATCGLTRAEGVAQWGRQGEWQAGHRVDSTIARTPADYQPQHAHCNQSDGATMGNSKREPNSGWYA